jgi:hypothetical protein
MKLETIGKSPEEMTEEVLLLDGRDIGWVKTKLEEGAHRCHVGLEFPKNLYWNLVQ